MTRFSRIRRWDRPSAWLFLGLCIFSQAPATPAFGDGSVTAWTPVDSQEPQTTTLILKDVPADKAVGLKVKVGDRDAAVLSVAEFPSILIGPPALEPGIKVLEVNDSAGQKIASGQLFYTPTSVERSQEARRNALLGKASFRFFVISVFWTLLVAVVASVIWTGRKTSQSGTTPLGLPPGSVRAILALTLVLYWGLYVMASVMSFSDFPPPDALLGVVGSVIGFYFASRGMEGDSGAKTAVVHVQVFKADGTAAVGAVVTFAPKSGLGPLSRTADATGELDLMAPPGTYQVSGALGAEKVQQDLELKEGPNGDVTLKLA